MLCIVSLCCFTGCLMVTMRLSWLVLAVVVLLCLLDLATEAEAKDSEHNAPFQMLL